MGGETERKTLETVAFKHLDVVFVLFCLFCFFILQNSIFILCESLVPI